MHRGQQTKHSSTLFPYPCLSPSAFLSPPLWRPIWTLQRMQRYRSYIEVAFQCNPHRADDRVLLKRKKACGGETSSLGRILEKYIENSPLWPYFFHFQEQFCTVPSDWSACLVERGGVEGGGGGVKEWRDAVFFMLVWSAKDVMKTNWQAVTIYLSRCRSALTWRRKTDPLLIQPGLHTPPNPHPLFHFFFFFKMKQHNSKTELKLEQTCKLNFVVGCFVSVQILSAQIQRFCRRHPTAMTTTTKYKSCPSKHEDSHIIYRV